MTRWIHELHTGRTHGGSTQGTLANAGLLPHHPLEYYCHGTTLYRT